MLELGSFMWSEVRLSPVSLDSVTVAFFDGVVGVFFVAVLCPENKGRAISFGRCLVVAPLLDFFSDSPRFPISALCLFLALSVLSVSRAVAQPVYCRD